jgi:hypothetical protein
MTASYQSAASVKSYTPEVDLVSTVMADNINSLQVEVVAIESALGSAATNQSPLISTYSGTFARTLGWSTLGDRLLNIEAGLVNGVANGPYVTTTGGNTITTNNNKGLVLAVNAGSNNLIETYSSSATLGFNVNSSGLPLVGTSNIVYVGSADFTALTAALTANTTLANTKIPLSTVTASGDLVVGSGNAAVTNLPKGSNGQALIVAANTVSWGTPTDTTKVPLSTVTAAGDLIVATASATVGRLPIGTAGQVLTASSGALSWQTPTVYLSTANAAVSSADINSGVVRNTFVKTVAPTSSDGNVGDIWIVRA